MDRLEKQKKQQGEIIFFPSHIFLIGFMGTGKTTVSAWLGKKLSRKETDTDKQIEKTEGKSISKIFEEDGEEYFRNCETALLNTFQQQEPLIISCGGGMALREENIVLMKKQGDIVLLTAEPKTIFERVKDSRERPILNQNMTVEFIAQLIQQRRDNYVQAADLCVTTDRKTVPEIGAEIIKGLKIEEMPEHPCNF